MSVFKSVYPYLMLLMGCCLHLGGQSNTANFKKLTTSAGLSNNTVYSIIQDDLGFIWAGTKSGLNRFDGYDFKTFPIPSRENGITSNPTVFSLLMDHSGRIWLGLKDNGLVAYDPTNDQFDSFPFDDDATVDWSTISVKSLYEDSRNWLWVGTYGGGAIVLNEDRQPIYHFCTYCNAEKKEQLSNDFVFDFEEDKKGDVYIATAGRGLNVFQLDTKNIRTIHATDREDMNSFGKTICLDSTNTLWIGTEGNGLYTFDTESQSWSTYRSKQSANSISSDIITDIQLDENGQLWLATDGGGLNKFNRASQKFQHFQYNSTRTNTLNTDALYDLHFDQSGNLWIGTFNGGINVLKAISPPFYTKRRYEEEKKLGLRSVLTVRQDKNGRVWLGTDGGGLFYFDLDAEFLELHNASTLLLEGRFDDVITCLQPQTGKGFWYGSFANGLHFFDTKKRIVQRFTHEEDRPGSLIHDNVWDLEMDKDGGLWIGTLGGGIDYLQKGGTTFQHFGDFENQLSDIQIIDLLLDRNNKYLWIATESRGLNRLDLQTKSVRQYQHDEKKDNTICSNNLLSLFEDRSGNIWIVSDVGIDKLNPKTDDINAIELNHRFQIGTINSLEEDGDGFMWVTTSTGIHRLNPEDYTITEFGTDPGLQNNMFNPKAACKLSDGRIVFGGVNGFSVVVPDKFQWNTNQATPVFTDFKISNQPIEVGQHNGRTILNKQLNRENVEVQLSYQDRGIAFEFSTTAFTAPSLNKFAYKLKGFEDDWNYVDATQRNVFYSSLKGGNYQLQLKAANSSGVWNEKDIRTIDIVVQPPFWKTNWFIVLMALLAIGAIFLTNRFLLNRQKEIYERQTLEQEQEILQLKNQNLVQEITNKKAELNASILQMAHKNEFLTVLKDRIHKIQNQSDDSAKKPLRSIVNFINSELRQEDYWEKFQLIFDQTFQDFIKQLEVKHPNLTQNDYRLSCFIKMKLNNHEIASILNITVNGVEQAKYRLKKKINLDKTENLNEYIQGFGNEQQS